MLAMTIALTTAILHIYRDKGGYFTCDMHKFTHGPAVTVDMLSDVVAAGAGHIGMLQTQPG